mmetsp:Transcript_20846/g.37801  ORF Transcript_20846/g.37801 Transcript_20846/m.37801 type:complete len:316 (+) Transcript_20846:150-1097(+)
MFNWLLGGAQLCCVKANTDEEVCVTTNMDVQENPGISKHSPLGSRSHPGEKIKSDPTADESKAENMSPEQGWQVRRKAIENLGKIGTFAIEDVTPRLVQGLHDEHWQVRRAAANSLRELGPQAVTQAKDALGEACHDRDNLVAAAASKALAAHGLPVPPPRTVSSHSQAAEAPIEQPSYCVAAETTEEEAGAGGDHIKMEYTDDRSTTASVKTSTQPTEFGIVLGCREGHRGRLGIDIDFGHPRYLKILKVYSGLIQDWNLAHPEMQVEAGDYFVEINGWSNNARKLMEVLTLANQLQIVVRKAESMASQRHVGV